MENLQQCDEKNDIQTREQQMLARPRELNWQIPRKKTHPFERKILFSIFSIWPKILNLLNKLGVDTSC